MSGELEKLLTIFNGICPIAESQLKNADAVCNLLEFQADPVLETTFASFRSHSFIILKVIMRFM
jgi:hypothetical protein